MYHKPSLYILGIESSCDETSAAVVTDQREILSNVVRSQWGEVTQYGGVVPEIAARAHLECMDRVIQEAMNQAQLTFPELSGIAVTAGPGLIGGVIVGVITAKILAACHNLPILAINHLEGHALTPRLTHQVAFPYLLLLLSGGHCQVLVVHEVGEYTLLGATLDDAVGEVFDKTAKLLELGFPGGPAIEEKALSGNPHRFSFPRPLIQRPGCDFSFSGLKTAVRRVVIDLGEEAFQPAVLADLCASFQEAVGDVLANRCRQGIAMCQKQQIPLTTCVMAGGVAANKFLRKKVAMTCDEFSISLTCPPVGLCTDNGAMIAWAGVEALQRGRQAGLDFSPRPRWPLGEGLKLEREMHHE